eukprot:g16624.t1
MSAVENSHQHVAHDDDAHVAAAAAAGQNGGAALSEPGGSYSATPEEGEGSSNAGQDFGWEGCKENVKPLKRGRKVDAILAGSFGGGLGGGGGSGSGDSGCSSSARVLADLKRHFEPLIADSAPDPRGEDGPGAGGGEGAGGEVDKLAIWWQYIQAVQDKLPSDQQEQFDLLERCSRRFKDDPRYKDDIRYLRVWTAYATHLSNAEDLFKFLYKKGIGGKHAHFWVGWALYAENAGNFPMAEKLYVKGIEHRRAEPLDVLKKRQAHFMRRMRRHWINSQIEGGTAEDEASELPRDEESRRGILRSLSVTATERVRRDQAAAVAARGVPDDENRGAVTGAGVRRGGRRLGERAAPSASGRSRGRGGGNGSTAGLGFAVFVEEEFTAGPEAAAAARARRGGGSSILDETPEDDAALWNDYGTRESRQKENNAKPSRWTDGALGDRPGVAAAPPAAAAAAAAAGAARRGERVRAAVPFPVYVDEQFADKAGEENRKAASADEKRVMRSTRALLAVAGGEQGDGKEQEEEEQVEEARARFVAEHRRARTASKPDSPASAVEMDICPSDSDDGQSDAAADGRPGGARGEGAGAGDAGANARVGGDGGRSSGGISGSIRQPVFGDDGSGGVKEAAKALPSSVAASAALADAAAPTTAAAAAAAAAGGDARQPAFYGDFGDENAAAADDDDRRDGAGDQSTETHGKPVEQAAGTAAGGKARGEGGAKKGHGEAFCAGSAASAAGTVASTAGDVGGGGGSVAVGANNSGDNAATANANANANANASASISNASVVFVNPREALGAEGGGGGGAEVEDSGSRGGGDGGGDAGSDTQRRLTFGHVAPAREDEAGASRAAGSGDDGGGGDGAGGGDAVTEGELAKEGEDMTINTKLVWEEMSTWFDGEDGEEGDKGGDGEEDAGTFATDEHDENVGATSGRHAPFEIFVDPDGSLSNAALLERERREAQGHSGQDIGGGDDGDDGDGRGREGGGGGEINCSGDGAPIRDEDEENLGCPPNPNAGAMLWCCACPAEEDEDLDL